MISGVRRVVVFEQGADGTLNKVAEYAKKTKKRKRSRGMKTPERNTRKLHGAMRAFVDEIDTRHSKSTRKKKDGWLRDGPKNTMKAQRKTLKKLRKIRLF
jgi:hypothetical protein